MNKIYSKILLTAILFFSYAQTIFAEEIGHITNYANTLRECFGGPGLNNIFNRLTAIFVFFPLSLFIVVVLLIFIYFKLRKKNTTKIKPLLNLGGICLLSTVFSYLATTQITRLLPTYNCSLIDLSVMFAAIKNVIKTDDLSLILVAISTLSLIVLIYYLILTVARLIVAKLKKRTLP